MANAALGAHIPSPGARAKLLATVTQRALPPLPDGDLPLAGFLARLINASGERGTVSRGLLTEAEEG